MAPLRIWVITDGRLGHLNQLRGLVARLEAKASIEVCTLDLSQQPFRCQNKRGLMRQFGAVDLPHWIIGAGSASHWPMIWCRWFTRARTLVLMKPDWPLWLFDAACIPAHDGPSARRNILVTQGVLNTMTPVVSGRDSHRGLILLGGINRHFHWDNGAVRHQILDVVEAAPELQWTLSDSPRTPDALMLDLAQQCPVNLRLVSYKETAPDWLKDQLSEAARVWVTCDSVSMVYECITSGTPTGLIDLPASRQSRVTSSMKQVVSQGLVLPWVADGENVLPEPAVRLWEADRAAEWVLHLTGERGDV